VFLAGSLPPTTDDVSIMIGSYGVISRHGLVTEYAPPTRAAAKIFRPLITRVGFTGSINDSEPHAIAPVTNNGSNDSESIQSASDNESSDSESIQLASDYESDDNMEESGSAGTPSPADNTQV
jgi:hypothetical protein